MKKIKNWIITFLFGTACIAGGFGALNMDKEVIIEDCYKLKADKEKILDSKEIDWIVEVKDEDGLPTGEIINKGKIKKYDYISDVEVATATLKIQDGKREKTIIEKVEKRTGNTQFFETGKVIDGKKEVIGHFYSGTPFIKQNKKWFHSETATTTIEAFKEQTKETLTEKVSRLFIRKALATDYYSGAGDGRCYNVDLSSWNASHDSVSSTHVKAGDVSAGIYQRTGRSVISRGFFPINTSALPDTATISSGSMNIVTHGPPTVVDSFALVQTYQASVSTLALADFEDCGSDNGSAARAKYQPVEGAGRILLNADFETGDTVTWTLNTTGKGWINKTGYTKLGLRSIRDADDAGSWTNSETSWYMSENTGTTNDPYLSVTYTTGATFTPKLFQF